MSNYFQIGPVVCDVLRTTCIKGLLRPKYKKMFFTNLFLLVYQNNNQSVNVSNYFDFYRCYGNKNGHQYRLKIGN